MKFWKVKSRIFLFLTTFSVIFFTNCIPFANNALNITPVAAFTDAKPFSSALPKSATSSQPATSATSIQAQAASPTVYLPTVMAETPAPPSVSGGFVADNTVIPYFNSIPQAAIDAAKAKKVLFYHQSTGGYIDNDGLGCLAGLRDDPDNFPAECSTYAQNPSYYSRDNWDWIIWPDLVADAPAKMDQFVSLVPGKQGQYDIIGMKYCYTDGWNQDFEQYRTKMEGLEKAYPNKVFIWSTSALWGSPGSACDPNNPFNSCLAISDFNQQVRAYTKANNKPLYDIASIESNGGACQVAGYEGLCSQYYANSGGHPTTEESIRLAKGFWWLMAKLSGWQ